LIQISRTTKKLSPKAENERPQPSERREKISVAFDLQLGNVDLENHQRDGDGENTIAESFGA
jgi:hypothetical protein